MNQYNSIEELEQQCPFESRNTSLTSMRPGTGNVKHRRILSAANSPQKFTSI